MAAQPVACPCMERIASEIAISGAETPTPLTALAACPQACWKDSASTPDHLEAEARVEGLCRWATGQDQKSLQRVRSLFHPFGIASPFSRDEKNNAATSSAVSSSSEPVASATIDGAQRPQDLASASSYLEITPEMIKAGSIELFDTCDESISLREIAKRVYMAMEKARVQSPPRRFQSFSDE